MTHARTHTRLVLGLLKVRAGETGHIGYVSVVYKVSVLRLLFSFILALYMYA